MTTSPVQQSADSELPPSSSHHGSSNIANPVKLEQEEQDELASDSPQDGAAVKPDGQAPVERSPSAASQSNLSQTKSPSVSHQQLQQVLFQQQQLQRSRPSPNLPADNGATTAARAMAHVQSRCALCGATNVPLWRREPNGKAICNTCGESTKQTARRATCSITLTLSRLQVLQQLDGSKAKMRPPMPLLP